MRGRRPESGFLRAIGPVGIFSMLEVESDFVKPLLGDEIFAFWA